jgi:hypothetical protein
VLRNCGPGYVQFLVYIIQKPRLSASKPKTKKKEKYKKLYKKEIPPDPNAMLFDRRILTRDSVELDIAEGGSFTKRSAW